MKYITLLLFFPQLILAQVDFDPESMRKDFQRSLNLDEPYQLTWLSKEREGVPKGQTIKKSHKSKTIYPGVNRDYWIYVPANYDKKTESNLIIFQDGEKYLFGDDFKAGVTLDNMISLGLIPQTIGIFINPGDKLVGEKSNWRGHKGDITNRSYEYDSTTDKYPKFLIEEILPDVRKKYNITEEPKRIVIGGISSGGICAFNAAWHRPEVFGNVISHCGSYTNIRGGDIYPQLVRQSKKKDIKVFLQSGEKDADIIIGSWPLKNKEMAAALEKRGYDYKFEFGVGGHSLKHGGQLFPETLMWLWSD